MSDTNKPDSDREYMLLRPTVTSITAFLESLERRGIEVEMAVIEMPSEDSSGTLSIELWDGPPEYTGGDDE